MNNLVIFPVIFFFLHTSPKLTVSAMPGFDEQTDSINLSSEDTVKTIYLIKQRWHTAVVFHIQDLDSIIFPEVKYFNNAELIDIGWGDEEFYQHPGFDLELAYQALFHSTPSTLRVEGIYFSKQKYFDISEIVIELKINNEQLALLLDAISETVWKDEEGNPEILSTQGTNRVIFFKAKNEYHLFNTCNTWLAKNLKKAGFDIEDDIILTEQLFNEAAKVGKVLKAE
ncbi:MAG: DUF2459 domain-containing protein [Ignavibacteria bacterium]|nr:DUF2459 domain-containing protein [Ignavibacteria bacterium]MBT8383022.1 DUF2459 domain-containing protein [Ignavibacteria bacterium]MBT8391875.1 DUF2459 domain-containing protein [Ignavibacteria bacterium]NNJ52970.1 DUF2459 domain-containing protein [Ignavibacteriaceae bacterium]NNL21445.1 DUF2459 domain-containing protein [Ignavibacteriaceae bacterium]